MPGAVSGFTAKVASIPPEVVHLFIVAGQSNARGQNQNAGWDTFPAQYKVFIPNAFINYAYNANADAYKFYALDGAVDSVSYRYRYNAIQYPFAKSYTEYKGKACYIIHHAIGTTGLGAGTSTPDWNAATVGGLYDQLVDRVTAAINNILALGKIPKIVSFYWNQGEQDAQVGSISQATYLALLNAFFTKFRNEAFIKTYFAQATLNLQIALLGTWTTTQNASYQTNRANIRAAQSQFVSQAGNAGTIETADLESIVGDEIHRTTPSQCTIGLRFFEAVKDLV
jgi:hypothetical protein